MVLTEAATIKKSTSFPPLVALTSLRNVTEYASTSGIVGHAPELMTSPVH